MLERGECKFAKIDYRAYNTPRMGLSEFTSRNNKELPDRQEEWKRGKLLIETIIESGAMLLLEQLRDSILHNSKLDNSNMELRKLLFLYNHPPSSNPFGVSNESIYNQFYQDQYLGKFKCMLPNKYMGKTPRVEVELRYNSRIIRTPSSYGPFDMPTFNRAYFDYDTLKIMCEDPKILNLSLCYYVNDYRREGSRSENCILEESQWKNKNIVDNALGELYSLSPAR